MPLAYAFYTLLVPYGSGMGMGALWAHVKGVEHMHVSLAPPQQRSQASRFVYLPSLLGVCLEHRLACQESVKGTIVGPQACNSREIAFGLCCCHLALGLMLQGLSFKICCMVEPERLLVARQSLAWDALQFESQPCLDFQIALFLGALSLTSRCLCNQVIGSRSAVVF